MSVRIDTNALPERDRKAFWREEVCQPFMCSAPAFRKDEAFHGRHDVVQVNTTVFMATTSSEYDVTRGPAELQQTPNDVMVLMRQRSGERLFTQNGRVAGLRPGDLLLLDSGSPMSSTMSSPGNLECIVMPRVALTPRLSRMEDRTARRLSADSSAGILLNDYTEMVLRLSGSQDPHARAWLESSFHDLVAMAFGARLHAFDTAPTTLRSARLETMLRQIDKRYRDPTLSPRSVAFHAGVSERYLHRLFESSSLSFRQSLVRRRLDEARRCLSDIQERHRSIADIAFACGFADLSGFNRSFKAAFGMTPRDMRSQMLLGADFIDDYGRAPRTNGSANAD